MNRNEADDRRARNMADDAAALDAALAALVAAAPPPLSEDFLRRVVADAEAAHRERAKAALRPTPPPSRGGRRDLRRIGRSGFRARMAAAAVGMAASAALGFLAGWTDLAGLAAPGFADADLLADDSIVVADWEDAL